MTWREHTVREHQRRVGPLLLTVTRAKGETAPWVWQVRAGLRGIYTTLRASGVCAQRETAQAHAETYARDWLTKCLTELGGNHE